MREIDRTIYVQEQMDDLEYIVMIQVNIILASTLDKKWLCLGVIFLPDPVWWHSKYRVITIEESMEVNYRKKSHISINLKIYFMVLLLD